MFTGIVETTVAVLDRTDTGLTLERPATFDDIRLGSSISVAGVCLSVIAFDERSMSFDVVPETLAKTKLSELRPGDRVNLERSMRAGDRFEGHVVQGHVEGVARVVFLKPGGQLSITIPSELCRFIIPKGSITLDGVSLTIADITDDICTIALIPHTLEHTTLGSLQPGDAVNIETDVMVRSLLSTI